jgi:WD40 repeat protein
LSIAPVALALLAWAGFAFLWKQRAIGVIDATSQEQAAIRKCDRDQAIQRYLNDVRTIDELLKGAGIIQARQVVVSRTFPTGVDDPPGFEWHYLSSLTHGESCTLRGHQEDVYHVAFSGDGRLLVSCGKDRTARLWDVTTRRELRKLEGHTDEINALAFSHDDRLLATGSDDGIVKIWEVATGRCTRTSIGHKKEVNTVAFTRDGRHLMSADRSPTPFRPDSDLRLILWDIESALPCDAQSPGVLMVETQVISRDGSTVAVGGPEGVRVWRNEAGQNSRGGPGFLLRHPLAPSERDPAREPLGISTDGRWVAIRTASDKIAVYESDSETPPRSYECGNGQAISVAFSPDGRSFATSSHDGVVRLYDRDRPVPRVLFFGQEKPLELWDLTRGAERVCARPVMNTYVACSLSDDRRMLATWGEQGVIQLWNAATLDAMAVLRGHTGHAYCAVFSPDGKTLATGDLVGFIRLWTVATWREFFTLAHLDGPVHCLRFSPDGRVLAAASAGTNGGPCLITLWHVAERSASEVQR